MNALGKSSGTGCGKPGGSHRQQVKREIIEFAKMVAWFLMLFFVLRTYVIEGYEVQGPSMMPTLEDRERILVFKLPHLLSHLSVCSGINAIEPGDIVVFKNPDDGRKRYVKRIIAEGAKRRRAKTVEAEPHSSSVRVAEVVTVRMERDGIYVNNRRIKQDYSTTGTHRGGEFYSELGPGKYFVLGDNRAVSKDSRSFGPVDDDDIVGKAVLRFWPLSRLSLLK